MTSVNIAIKKEAYNFLKNLKSKDKSFSDVILSFKKDRDNIINFFGVMKEADWNEKEGRMKGFRNSFSRRLQ